MTTGRSPAVLWNAARRSPTPQFERREETGVHCEVVGLVGLYTNPAHVILYTSDGEVRQECSFVFEARAAGGTPTPSSESSQVRWVPRDELDGYSMHRSMRERVERFLE